MLHSGKSRHDMEEQQSDNSEQKALTWEEYIRYVIEKLPPQPEHDCVARYRIAKTSSFRTVGRIYETVTYPIPVYGGIDKKGKPVFRRRHSFRMTAGHIGKKTTLKNPDTEEEIPVFGFYHENVRLLTVCCIDDEPLFLLGCLRDLLGISQPEKFAKNHLQNVKDKSAYLRHVELPMGCAWRTISDKHSGVLALTRKGLRKLCMIDKRVSGIKSRDYPHKQLTGRDIWQWVESEVLPTLEIMRQGDPEKLTDAGDWDKEIEELAAIFERQVTKREK